MNTNHLSAWEQEEYILQQDANQQTLNHLQECGQCRDAVAGLQNGLASFRSAVVDWSSECLASRPQQWQVVSGRRVHVLRWAVAAVIPLVLLLLALAPLHLSAPRPTQKAAQISDDALMEQVDEQVSVSVPSSMESLTHLVSTRSNSSDAGSGRGGGHFVETN
jgi:hypothetical protein